jgi:hypothetical protein
MEPLVPNTLEETYKALAIVDDTTKQDAMKIVDGFSSNFTEVKKDTLVSHENVAKYDKPIYAAAEAGSILIVFLAVIFFRK